MSGKSVVVKISVKEYVGEVPIDQFIGNGFSTGRVFTYSSGFPNATVANSLIGRLKKDIVEAGGDAPEFVVFAREG